MQHLPQYKDSIGTGDLYSEYLIMQRIPVSMACINMKFYPAFLLFYLFACAWIQPASADNRVSIDTPPASLEKWYKPANKRQVWLHTMFRLRREMQAISEYAEQNDKPEGRIQGLSGEHAQPAPEKLTGNIKRQQTR